MTEPKETIFSCKIFDVCKTYQIGRSGTKHSRYLVRHPGGVGILPILNDGRAVLIRQFRIAVENYIYEIPAGMREPGEAPQNTAERELIEETGYRAERWTQLPSFYATPGYDTERIYLYMAEGLTEGEDALEDGEDLKVSIFTRDEIIQMIDRCEIEDGKTLVALLWWLNRK